MLRTGSQDGNAAPFFFFHTRRAAEGMTFIEMLVGIAILLIVFLGLFAAFQLSINLVFSTKAKTGAVALVNEKLEYIRGLSYDAVGTVGGIPGGNIPQTEQKTLNNITYTLSTLVQYVDDPADGTGASDQNGITADYKTVRVEADWMVAGSPRSTFAVTEIAPPGIETLANGGTLTVNVFDAFAKPIEGASVRVVNPSTTPAIDVTVESNSMGVVTFPGTPVATNYMVSATKSGYSTAQTYNVTAQNPNPSPGNIAVINKKTSTISLAIDALGSLAVSTFSPAAQANFTDSFANQSQLSATTSATVSGGSLRLSGTAGSYPASGSGYSMPIAPQYLSAWNSLSFTGSSSPQASLSVHVYYWNGSAYVPVPDSALPGNSA
ncbi:MAG: carboxypeptidase regulatory-like domain-containing protein, partial [Patescibacteria group bacterium]|nr:carboxypeptidase regulatory-like domain-containing protein [Patescibacteria group bacterium]